MMHLAFCAPAPILLRGAWSRGFVLAPARGAGRPWRASIIRASSTTALPPTTASSKPSSSDASSLRKTAPTFQDAVRILQDYWAAKGCLIWHPCNTEVGAGTMNPATFLRVLGPEPWSVAYEEPSLRPDDSRYGENPNRLQRHTQFQVIVKPAPECAQELVLGSYRALGIDLCKHDVRFVEDNWQSPALGAWGLGWEVWLDGMEVTQFTYFQQAGGVPLQNVAVEVTYGLERIIMSLQGKTHFKDILFAPGITYGEIFMQNEFEMSVYNLEDADVRRNALFFDEYEAEAKQLLEKRLPIPAYSYLLKASHTFNVLDARGAVGVTERARFFQRMRTLAREVATLWTERREELGFPLLSASSETDKDKFTSPNTPPSLHPPRPLADKEQFVLEIGMEELPPTDLDSMIAQVKSLFLGLLSDASLRFDDIKVTGTPRRVAVLVNNLQTRQEDTKDRVRGPPIRAALDKDGKPTRAALGFLKKQGISDISFGEFDHQEGYLYATVERKGNNAIDVLAAAIPAEVLGKISFGKAMRWNDTGISFSRPVRWLLCFVGEHQVPFHFSGVSSGSVSRSLRGSDGFASSILMKAANEYEKEMEDNQIMLCLNERRDVISRGCANLVSEIRGKLLMDEGLLEEVTNLVENPIPVLGRFDSEFLGLPDEVLITVMKKHQRYFPVTDATTGSLLNAFITVVNGDANLVDLAAIRAGNEAVLRARYADASFFYENDTKGKKLADFVPLLDRLAFQESLGSMLDKTNRITKIVAAIGEPMGLPAAEQEVADSAAKLAKADLATSMVIEMTSLAGVMGKHYTQKSGEVSEAVSEAIFEAALPRFSGDSLAKALAGAVVGIADRLDSLISLFGIGLAPKATADPFALRRAALGIVQTMIEREINCDVSRLIQIADISSSTSAENRQLVLKFVEKRLESYLMDGSGVALRPDVIKAVLAVPQTAQNPFVAYQTAVSLQRALDEEPIIVHDAAGTHSRAARLLKSIGGASVGSLASQSVDETLFDTVEEAKLLQALSQVQSEMQSSNVSIEERLRKVAGLKGTVDEFFDNVFVNAEDEKIRYNRQVLSAQLVELTESTLDLALLQLE